MTFALRATLTLWAAFALACTPTHRVPQTVGSFQKPVTADWNSISAGIFFPRCMPCHNPRGQARFLDLSSRDSVLAARDKLFNFADPEASYLIEVIRDPLEPMPPPTSSLRPLSEDEVLVLIDWIAQGLP
jgi:Planctomycete cytochrome C